MKAIHARTKGVSVLLGILFCVHIAHAEPELRHSVASLAALNGSGPATESPASLSGLREDVARAISSVQRAPIPYHKEAYLLDSGVHENTGEENVSVFKTVVGVSGAEWLKLHISDHSLGAKSFVTFTSLKDSSQQRVDSAGLVRSGNSSVYFNGDSVEVELWAAPGESGIFIKMVEVDVGEPAMVEESQCGDDDRVASTDNRIGRIEPAGCTGWRVSNRAYLTAGHCTLGTGAWMNEIEFNVPASNANGTPNHPPASDQYPIDPASIVFFDDGDFAIGNDWAVFEVLANTTTGLLPIEAYGGFFRMTIDILPNVVRVTGYGADVGVDNYTQQTDSDSFLSETVDGASDVTLEYTVDTEGGSSGSPVIDTVLGLTVGIHTNGVCTPPTEGNEGTGFENNNLENAIQTAPGANVEYVDKGHYITNFIESGTVFRPYDTVLEGVNAASGANAIVSIVAGPYYETMTINKAVTLEAPIGSVTIGP